MLGRDALVATIRSGRVVAVEGPAGAGKSELVRQARPDAVWVAVQRRGWGVDDLVRGLAEAELAAGGPGPLVVDDVHDLAPEAVAHLAGLMPEAAAAVVVGRSVPAALLAAADVRVGDADLRLDDGDLDALAPGLAAAERRRLADASGGWIGAAALLVDQRRRGDRNPLDRPAAVASTLRGIVAGLSPEQAHVIGVLACLPLLPDGIDEALSAPGALEAARNAGLPLTHGPDGRWSFTEWVRDHVRVPFTPTDATALSRWYCDIGEPAEAVAVLLDAGLDREGAHLLAGFGPAELDVLDVADLDPLIARLPARAVAAEPRVLLLLARACADAVLISRRTALLERLAGHEGDPALAVDVLAEQARDLARDGEIEAAEGLAVTVLDEARSDQLHARAVAFEVRGRAAAWWASTDKQLAAARSWLEQGLAAARRLGSADLQAAILGFLAYRVDFTAGRVGAAADQLAEAGHLIAGRPRRRAMLLTFEGEVLHHAGRFVEAAAALDDAGATAEALADDRLIAYVAWERARGAGWQGRGDEVLQCIGVVERHAAEWFEHPSGMVFLAEMADLLDRCGDVVGGARLLQRATDRMAELGIDDPDVLTVAAAVEARGGEPEVALALLDRVDATGALAPVRRWRIDLLRAHARGRRGEDVAAAAAAALEGAALAGIGDALAHQEPGAVAALAGLAAAAGSPEAARLLGAGRTTQVSVLGRFDVSAGGLAVPIPSGHPATLVKLLAALGGRAHVEVVLDALWPDESAANGRKLLRNILTRLRRGLEGQELVVRDAGGDVLAFAPDVEVDAIAFGAGIDRARGLALVDLAGAATVARVAIAQYRGDLLPDDRYEDWAAGPREVLRARLRAGLHLLADHAAAAGRLDDAARHLERVIDVEPLDPVGHERLVALLDGAGRRGAAARARARAAAVDEELGVT